jgi:hypothetical protein
MFLVLSFRAFYCSDHSNYRVSDIQMVILGTEFVFGYQMVASNRSISGPVLEW